MLKKELRKLRRNFDWSCSKLEAEDKRIIHITLVAQDTDEEIGFIHGDRYLGEVFYQVIDVSCAKGLGKLLYYEFMARVFPYYVTSDFNGCSKDAFRVWAAIAKQDYVEQEKHSLGSKECIKYRYNGFNRKV